jgi:hypothetical protein
MVGKMWHSRTAHIMMPRKLRLSHYNSYVLVVLGFVFWVLHLLGRCSATWATTRSLFDLVIFQVDSHIFVWMQSSYL